VFSWDRGKVCRKRSSTRSYSMMAARAEVIDQFAYGSCRGSMMHVQRVARSVRRHDTYF
jgi:hypothetical protein